MRTRTLVRAPEIPMGESRQSSDLAKSEVRFRSQGEQASEGGVEEREDVGGSKEDGERSRGESMEEVEDAALRSGSLWLPLL